MILSLYFVFAVRCHHKWQNKTILFSTAEGLQSNKTNKNEGNERKTGKISRSEDKSFDTIDLFEQDTSRKQFRMSSHFIIFISWQSSSFLRWCFFSSAFRVRQKYLNRELNIKYCFCLMRKYFSLLILPQNDHKVTEGECAITTVCCRLTENDGMKRRRKWPKMRKSDGKSIGTISEIRWM